MNQPLPNDIVARVRRDFGERADAVLSLLLGCRRVGSSDHIDDRLVRCIVFTARGDESRVGQLIELGRQDYWEVISAAEFDDSHFRQLRDFDRPFESADIVHPIVAPDRRPW